MKFTTTSKSLAGIITAAIAHSTKNAASIGGFFLLDAKGETLTVTASCVGSGYRGFIPVTIKEEGAVCVVADKLQAFVAQIAQMGDVEMEFETNDKGMILVKSNETFPKAKISLRTRNKDTFPAFEECSAEKMGEIEVGLFSTALQHVAPIAEKTNPTETCRVVHIEQGVQTNEETGKEENLLKFVSTNGKSLGTESYVLGDGMLIPGFSCANIPVTAIPKIIAIIGKDDKGNTDEPLKAKFGVCDGKAYFKTATAEIYVSLYADKYCAWERVIPHDRPEAPIKWIDIDGKELARTVVMAGITSDAEFRKVNIGFSNEGIKVSSENKDSDSLEMEISCEMDITPIDFKYNGSLLLPCLKGLEGAKEPGEVTVKFGYMTNTTATLLKRADGKGPLYVIMPAN